jgi:hypothetical protein
MNHDYYKLAVWDERMLCFRDGNRGYLSEAEARSDATVHGRYRISAVTLKRIAIFYKITFERAVRAFDDLKNQILTMCYANLNSVNCYYPSEGDRATAELKVLQKKALSAKADYDKALAAIEAAKPEQHKRNEQGQIQNQQANKALLSVVEAINV